MLVAAQAHESKREDLARFAEIQVTGLRDKSHEEICSILVRSTHLFRSGNRNSMFSRSQNDNTTFNTRCLYCFLTIASDVESSGELDRLEAKHICPEKALARMLANEESIGTELPRIPHHLSVGGGGGA
jgi:hypothetical protein